VTLVVDASVVAASLIDEAEHGAWSEQIVRSDDLAAPHFLHAEVAHALRRWISTGLLSEDAAARAYGDLLTLRIELFPYHSFAFRIWELRHNVTPYDAWYVALAESLDMPLATLDRRLAQATGPRCRFVTPPLA